MTLADLVQRLRHGPHASFGFGQFVQQQVAFETGRGGGHLLLPQPRQALLRPQPLGGDLAVRTQQTADRVLTGGLPVHHAPAVFDQLPPALDVLAGHIGRGHFVQIQQLRQLAGVDRDRSCVWRERSAATGPDAPPRPVGPGGTAPDTDSHSRTWPRSRWSTAPRRSAAAPTTWASARAPSRTALPVPFSSRTQ